MIFAAAGLTGPLIVPLIGVDDLVVYEIVAVLWITWFLAAWENSMPAGFAVTIAVTANVVLFAAVGAIASISQSLIWKSAIGLTLVILMWLLSKLLDGSLYTFLVGSAVWVAALVLTVVPKLDGKRHEYGPRTGDK